MSSGGSSNFFSNPNTCSQAALDAFLYHNFGIGTPLPDNEEQDHANNMVSIFQKFENTIVGH